MTDEWKTIEEKRHDQYSYLLIQENEAGERRTVYVDGNGAFLFDEAKGEIIDILCFSSATSRMRKGEKKEGGE
jgi:hypothetical protein